MKKRLISVAISIAILFSSLFSAVPVYAAEEKSEMSTSGVGASGKPASDGNILRMWYTKPAADWTNDALVQGNGSTGLMAFGNPSKERLHFNENTLWQGGPSTSRPGYNGGNRTTAVTQAQLNAIREQADNHSTSVFPLGTGGLTNVMGTGSGMGMYQDFGDIYVDFSSTGVTDSNVSNYVRDLNMRTAVSSVNYDYQGVHYKREYFVSYPDQVAVVRLTASEAGKLTFTTSVSAASGLTTTATADADQKRITLAGQVNDNQMKCEMQLKLVNEGGSVSSSDGKTLTVTGADTVTLVYSTGTNYKNEYPAYRGEDPHSKIASEVDAAAAKGYDTLLERHLADYQELFSRVEIDLGAKCPEISTDQLMKNYRNGQYDPAVEEMAYQFGRYLTIAGSREGNLPTNLCGLWLIGSASSFWGADFHFNVNVQMNYWPTMETNLAECAMPFNNFVKSLVVPGRLTAERSAAVKTDNFDTTPIGQGNGFLVNTQNNPFGCTAPFGSQEYGWNIGGSSWALQNVYDYYLFTGDEEFLRNTVYPMLKEQANFWNQFLWYSDYQKRLVVGPSVSAEQGPTVNGTTYDQSIVWELYKMAIDASETLGVDEDLRQVWQQKQSQLNPIIIGEQGQVKEWFEETRIDVANKKAYAQAGNLPETTIPNFGAGGSANQGAIHRHTSQLVGLFPGTLISKDTTEWMQAAIKTLEQRSLNGTGWSKAMKINMYARTGIAEDTYSMVRGMCAGNTNGLLDNLLDSHPPFQIDGNYGLTAGMTEMLLQSQSGYTQFLPALPSAWKDGSIKGIVARGNFVIDMVWSKGTGDQFKVTSRNGGKFIGEYAGITNAVVKESDGTPVAVKQEGADKISFDTQKGKTYVINLNSNASKLNEVIEKAKAFSDTMTGDRLETAKGTLNAAIAHAEKLIADGAPDYTEEMVALNKAIGNAETAVGFSAVISHAQEVLKGVTIGTELWEYSQSEYDALSALIDNCIGVLKDSASTPEAMKGKQAELEKELAVISERAALLKVNIQQQGTEVAMDSYYKVPEIRYTLDGSEPTAYSNLYKTPLTMISQAKMRAALFYKGAMLGTVSMITIPSANIAPAATQVNATTSAPGFDGTRAVDNNDSTYWMTAVGTTEAVLELTFAEEVKVDQAMFRQQYSATNFNISRFNIEYWEDGEWKVAYSYSGDKISSTIFKIDLPTTVTSNKIRMNILECTRPVLYEFQLYNVTPQPVASDKSTLQAEFAKAQVAVTRGVMEDPSTSTSESEAQKSYNWSYNYVKTVVESNFADQVTVDDAYENLHAMLAKYKLVTAYDPAALTALRDAAAALTLTDYDDPDKVAAFSETLANASALIADSGALQAELDAMCTRLTAVRDAMTATVKDWTSLLAMISIADAIQQQIDGGAVYESGVEQFTAGRAAALDIAAKPETRQQQINEAAEALKAAIAVLVPAVPDVGKEALMATIELGNLTISRGVINSLSADEKAAFNQALIEAKVALNNPAADQASVDAANTALNNKLTELKLNRATDKQALQDLYNTASALVLTDYDDLQKVASFKAVLEAAGSLLNDANALQREIDSRITPLTAAMDAMKATVKDRTKLQNAITTANQKLPDAESGKYVEADVRTLKHAISSAQTILETPESSQAQMDDAVKAIENAINGLRVKADKSKLAALIETAEKINVEAYTEESGKTLLSMLTNAILVRDNPNLSVNEQAQVDQAVQDLQNAINGLKLKPADTPSGTNTTTQNTVIIRERNTTTQKEQRTLQDPDSGISIIVFGVPEDARLSVVPIKKDSQAYKALTAAIQNSQTLILAFDISLQQDGSTVPYEGEITLNFPVGDQYNGQTLTLLHYVDGAIESYTGIVQNGVLTITVSHLSPFIVLANKPGATQSEPQAADTQAEIITGLPHSCTLYEGGQITWIPSPAGGTWTYDESYLTKTENGDSVTFKAVKPGSTSISYTANEESFNISVTIKEAEEAEVFAEGQNNSTLLWILVILAVACGGAAVAYLIIRKKRKSNPSDQNL